MLRFTVGSPADFEVTGAEFLAYLKLLVRLRPQHKILDIGCGCGMMALQLRDYIGGGGSFVGMDIDPRAINWCQAHITPRYPNFAFYQADLENPRYAARGGQSAASYRFPHPDADFDVILVKSVFTHMRPGGVENYLHEIARLLKPDGCCLATFFLLNAESGYGHADLTFNHGDEDCRYADPMLPEKAVAYRESWVLEMAVGSGLKLATPPYYGAWSGRRGGLSFQDILLLIRSCGVENGT
jgi:SAM-dependent methyltransferase